MNQRYPRKRALYLAGLAQYLASSSDIGSMRYSCLHGNRLRPVLLLTPSGISLLINIMLYNNYQPSRALYLVDPYVDLTINSLSLHMLVLEYLVLVMMVLWCPVCQVKTLQASPCVFMPVRLLGSSSPAVSTRRGTISGQSGTAVCRCSRVRFFIHTRQILSPSPHYL